MQEHLSPKGARLLAELRAASADIQPICTSAPVIWDAETAEDARDAKKLCLGYPATSEISAMPRCPLVALCLQTAIENDERYGVWGGTTYSERRKLRVR